MKNFAAISFRESLKRLTGNPCLALMLRPLKKQSAMTGSQLTQTLVREIPAFTESRNPWVLPQLENHLSGLFDEVLRLLEGGQVEDFLFVQVYAKDCANNYFPMESILHAYRYTHREFLHWLNSTVLSVSGNSTQANQCLVDCAECMLEFTDAISSAFTQCYLEQERLLSAGSGDHRAELLSLLLQGHDESDARISRILRNAGYLDRRQSFCVAVAQSVDPGEMFHPGRARRLMDAIDKILQNTPSHRLIDLVGNKVVIVFSHIRRVSGWSTPHSQLAERLKAELLAVGNAALIGVSNDVPSTSQIPSAYKEAQLALELADVTRRVVQISEVSLQSVMLQLSGDRLQPILPAWRKDFYATDNRMQGALVETLRAYAHANMNVLKAAQELCVHPNTVYSRMQKIMDITGMNARNYNALTELLLIADSRYTVPVSV